MIVSAKHNDLRGYLMWAAGLKLGMHCKTTTELADLLTHERNQKSTNFIALNIAEVGRKINLELCPSRNPSYDWFANHWPFIAQQPGYKTFP